jgi:hypothetical protein
VLPLPDDWMSHVAPLCEGCAALLIPRSSGVSCGTSISGKHWYVASLIDGRSVSYLCASFNYDGDFT